ncbi:uncharacterized protein LOC131243712 [Magnolia sinica]|uniref:uncharacterized protein LOC131243712 n=1 Tax=Magnolia sinica TaxID=86752 RepID=UPI00265AA50A|nr:uncharacterized protein LOC131243712 [Magnolia sinica]XP_058099216.1 uncharacterized protein LOC131243712 [Magnolia sinica]XP_058099217.1 uncharacterized protein LOC131243712 [Magnolia sinica]XP_058099218.1 uncharacterized protein LOC131243712 [Magnolia sinica]
MKESTATMEIQLSRPTIISPSSSSSSSSNPNNHNHNENPNNNNENPNSSNNSNNPMQSWWESISKARSRIQALSSILPPSSSSILSALADSDRPARSLLESPDASLSISAALSAPYSGSGDDPLCHWLYDTFLSSDPDLCLIVLSFIPLLSGIYLSRVVSAGPAAPSLAGFEAVLLSLYASETKARAGKPVLISVPDLSYPSLYHSPRNKPPPFQSQPSVGVLSAPLEPQSAIKSTKRACIVAVALDCYHKKISLMPSRSKIDLCEFAAAWAGQDCSCPDELDSASLDGKDGNSNSFMEIRISGDGDEIESVGEEMGRLGIVECSPKRANGHCTENGASLRGSRIPLPWELFQVMLRNLGHCLLAPLNPQEVRDAASVAVRCLYARALHDLIPQAILATRSLIQLDKRARALAKEAAAANSASNPNTPSKPKKPEILLVSK